MNTDFNQIIQKKLTQMEDEGIIQKKIEGNCPVKPWVGRYGNRSEAISAWNRRAEHE